MKLFIANDLQRPVIAWNVVDLELRARQWPTLPGLKKRDWNLMVELSVEHAAAFMDFCSLFWTQGQLDAKGRGRWHFVYPDDHALHSIKRAFVPMIKEARDDAELMRKNARRLPDLDDGKVTSIYEWYFRGFLTEAQRADCGLDLIDLLMTRILAIRLRASTTAAWLSNSWWTWKALTR